MEQTLLTDQDNALVIAEEGHESYFQAMAARVVRGLLAAGFPPCSGDFMATTWRRPLVAWERLFSGWVATPEPRALLEALNFFDFRPVSGSLRLEALDAIVARAGRERLFMAQFARASIGLSPPLGTFRQIRLEDGGVDVKKGGLAPIVSLARLYALDAGSAARSTLERLKAASSAGVLSQESAETLEEGFRFLIGLRLREQLRALRQGTALSNAVRIERLAAIERQHLKDVFVAIRELQRATADRYGIHGLA